MSWSRFPNHELDFDSSQGSSVLLGQESNFATTRDPERPPLWIDEDLEPLPWFAEDDQDLSSFLGSEPDQPSSEQLQPRPLSDDSALLRLDIPSEASEIAEPSFPTEQQPPPQTALEISQQQNVQANISAEECEVVVWSNSCNICLSKITFDTGTCGTPLPTP